MKYGKDSIKKSRMKLTMINFKEEQERSSHLYNKYQKGANVLLKRSIAAIDTMANRFNMAL